MYRMSLLPYSIAQGSHKDPSRLQQREFGATYLWKKWQGFGRACEAGELL